MPGAVIEIVITIDGDNVDEKVRMSFLFGFDFTLF